MEEIKLSTGERSVSAISVTKKKALVYTEDEDMKARLRVAVLNDPEYASILFDEGDGVLVAVLDKKKFLFSVQPGSKIISILVANEKEGK